MKIEVFKYLNSINNEITSICDKKKDNIRLLKVYGDYLFDHLISNSNVRVLR